MGTAEREHIWKKPRVSGSSAFMRSKRETAYLNGAIASHPPDRDERIMVFNDCEDETPENCADWASSDPEKIKAVEYEPRVVPIGTPDPLTKNPCSHDCVANCWNFALSLANCKIAIMSGGSDIALTKRFVRVCNRVPRELPPEGWYPIFGLNITRKRIGEIAIYHHHDFTAGFTGDRGAKRDRLHSPRATTRSFIWTRLHGTCWIRSRASRR